MKGFVIFKLFCQWHKKTNKLIQGSRRDNGTMTNNFMCIPNDDKQYYYYTFYTYITFYI